jgi:hypothetical protein
MAPAIISIECHCPLRGSQCRIKPCHRRIINSIDLAPEELDENDGEQGVGLREVRVDRDRLFEHEPCYGKVVAIEPIHEF